MELCILSGKRECFSLNCTCAGSPNGGTNLNLDERELKFNHKKKVMSNACDKEGEPTDKTAKGDNEKNHITTIESNKQNNNRNNIRGNGSNLRRKGSFVLLCSFFFYSVHVYYKLTKR